MQSVTRRTVLSSLAGAAALAVLALAHRSRMRARTNLKSASHRRPARRALVARSRLFRRGRDEARREGVGAVGRRERGATDFADREPDLARRRRDRDRAVHSKTLGNVVAEARKAGIKVVSYDRLILDADVDAYISFDNEKVGELQAQGVYDAKPKGNYFLLAARRPTTTRRCCAKDN